MNKDIIQLICNFLTPAEFYIAKNIYGLSANNYISNTKVNTTSLPIDGSHEMTRDFILRNVINDEDVIDYALKFDKPEYVKLSCVEDKFWITRNTYTERVAPQICAIPNIIAYNYKENGLRLPPNYLDVIFENNCIELMKLVQDYPEKSNVDVTTYGRTYNDLWSLNYKHKIAHILVNCCKSESRVFFCMLLWIFLITISMLVVYLECDNIKLCDVIIITSFLMTGCCTCACVVKCIYFVDLKLPI